MLTTGFDIIGNHPKFKKSLETAKNVAVTKTPVLVSGETGSGKKSLCSYIHSNSARKNAALEMVDCSLDIQLVEKQILGHRDEETGKFNRGVLEAANGGTVVFAHIDALDENFQKRLYTILQELSDYELDVRILATTTKNLTKLVGAGKFSRALYNFFSGAQITTTPLRERGTDVELLANQIVTDLCTAAERPVVTLTPEAIARLCDLSWNKNITELEAFLENALANVTTEIMDVAAFEASEKREVSFGGEIDEEGFKLMSLREAEKLLIKKALVYTAENRTQAAKILGVSIRTLRNKINEYRNEGSQYFVNLR
jgi:two-component system response regulator FlrC